MATSTNRNNIKPMFRFISVPMMILLCLVVTVIALMEIRSEQFATFDSNTYCTYKFFIFRMAFLIAFLVAIVGSSTFFSMLITLLSSFTFFALPIAFLINFELFAFRTKFCFNCFSHSLFPYKRLRLEPTSVVGLFYCIA